MPQASPPGMPDPREILDFVQPVLRRSLSQESREDIEDCAQEVYLKVWDAFEQYGADGVRNAKGLMTRIATGVAKNYIRRKVNWRKYRELIGENNRSTGEHRFWTPVENVQTIVVNYFDLNDEKRCAEIGRLYFHEFRLKEIAHKLEEKPATVRQQWRRCVIRLRKALRSQAEGLVVLQRWVTMRGRDIEQL